MFMWVKTNLHQDKILLPLTCLPFSLPVSFPLLIHTRPIPIPHTFRSHPTHLLPPSHSPSVCSPLSFRSQPTPLLSAARSLSVPNPLPVRPQPTPPSPLLPELVHLLPCLLSPPTCSLVHSSTRQLTMLLIELVHLLPCLFLHTTCSLVSPSTRQFTMLLSELVHLLPCLLIQLTCSLVHSLIRLLVNYFYHLTFLSVLFQNTATQILPFLSPTSTVKNITINKTSH